MTFLLLVPGDSPQVQRRGATESQSRRGVCKLVCRMAGSQKLDGRRKIAPFRGSSCVPKLGETCVGVITKVSPLGIVVDVGSHLRTEFLTAQLGGEIAARCVGYAMHSVTATLSAGKIFLGLGYNERCVAYGMLRGGMVLKCEQSASQNRLKLLRATQNLSAFEGVLSMKGMWLSAKKRTMTPRIRSIMIAR